MLYSYAVETSNAGQLTWHESICELLKFSPMYDIPFCYQYTGNDAAICLNENKMVGKITIKSCMVYQSSFV